MLLFCILSWVTFKRIWLQNYKDYTVCPESLGWAIDTLNYYRWFNACAQNINLKAWYAISHTYVFQVFSQYLLTGR